jgi:ribosomal protein S18 acetylase RimI-like enzyme
VSTATVTLRPATRADDGLLLAVYASTRLEELAPLGWPDDAVAAFLDQQGRAQLHHYRTHYPTAACSVVELDREPVGRLWLHRSERELRIVDIALLPAARNVGIGTALLAGVIAEADAAGILVSIHVEKNNPALRLYERLGFAAAEDKGIYWFMTRQPAPAGEGADR